MLHGLGGGDVDEAEGWVEDGVADAASEAPVGGDDGLGGNGGVDDAAEGGGEWFVVVDVDEFGEQGQRGTEAGQGFAERGDALGGAVDDAEPGRRRGRGCWPGIVEAVAEGAVVAGKGPVRWGERNGGDAGEAVEPTGRWRDRDEG